MLLIFPPQAPPFIPHLSLAQLSGYLRKHGHETTVLDLNTNYYHEVLHSRVQMPYESDTLSFFHQENFYKYKSYVSAMNRMIFHFFNYARNSNIWLKFFGAKYEVDETSSEAIYAYLENEMINLELFYEKELKFLIEKQNCIGISVGYKAQLIPALILCKFIKRRYGDVFVFLGGSHITTQSSEV